VGIASHRGGDDVSNVLLRYLAKENGFDAKRKRQANQLVCHFLKPQEKGLDFQQQEPCRCGSGEKTPQKAKKNAFL
jgi:hypothetical protein